MSEARQYDRTDENIGNVLNMEHINLTVPDQQVAALFYVTGLGFTRDPYIDFGTFNMWVNTGEQQFHLPKSTAQRWRGHIGVVVPSLDDLKRRLQFVAKPLADTEFACEGARRPYRRDLSVGQRHPRVRAGPLPRPLPRHSVRRDAHP